MGIGRLCECVAIFCDQHWFQFEGALRCHGGQGLFRDDIGAFLWVCGALVCVYRAVL